MTVAAPTIRPCNLCGHHDRAERMIYSRHTRKRYCGDPVACERRAKRKDAA